jgi:hypothetical protein
MLSLPLIQKPGGEALPSVGSLSKKRRSLSPPTAKEGLTSPPFTETRQKRARGVLGFAICYFRACLEHKNFTEIIENLLNFIGKNAGNSKKKLCKLDLPFSFLVSCFFPSPFSLQI